MDSRQARTAPDAEYCARPLALQAFPCFSLTTVLYTQHTVPIFELGQFNWEVKGVFSSAKRCKKNTVARFGFIW
jgi:hypothetical protein